MQPTDCAGDLQKFFKFFTQVTARHILNLGMTIGVLEGPSKNIRKIRCMTKQFWLLGSRFARRNTSYNHEAALSPADEDEEHVATQRTRRPDGLTVSVCASTCSALGVVNVTAPANLRRSPRF